MLAFANAVYLLPQIRLNWFVHVERMFIKIQLVVVGSLKLTAKE